MKLTPIFILSGLLISTNICFAEEGMSKMPRIKPKKVFSIRSDQEGEELMNQRGYGDKEPEVRMMNLMMVGSSGYEGMEMSESPGNTKHSHPISAEEKSPVPKPAEGQTASYDISIKIIPNPPQVGTNTLIVNLHRKNDSQPGQGLKVKAQVYMTSMDMGTEEPKVRETAPGAYQLKVPFSMKGPWAVKLILPEGGEKVFNFEVGSQK